MSTIFNNPKPNLFIYCIMLNNVNKKFYLAGIRGISMSAIAAFLKSFGLQVFGSDEVCGGDEYDNLKNMGIEIFSNLTDEAISKIKPDVFIYSVAIKEDNPEFQYAINNGLEIYSRGYALGQIANNFKKTIAISGSHGKTTTTSLVSHILNNSGIDPTCHIGGIAKNFESNYKIGKSKEVFVTEACEYYDSFLNLSPYISAILNIGEDHLDYFKTIDNLKRSFEKFADNTVCGGFLIANKDDKSVMEIANNQKHKKIITYSINDATADVYISTYRKLYDGKMVFDCVCFGEIISEIYLPLVGKHNLYNALVSIIVAKIFNIDDYSVRQSIASFEGVARRYEFVGRINGASVIHDYAHHPDEICAVIDETKTITKGNVIVVFQPHTYSRTKILWNDFSKALKKAYRIILYPIYSAREEAVDGVTSEELCNHICENGGASYYVPDFEKLYELLKRLIKPNDSILILGAGDIVNFTKYLSIH